MIISQSYMNCHAIGVHSVVLRLEPMRRIYFTTPDHKISNIADIAIHSHHSDITLVPLFGDVENWLASLSFNGTRYDGYKFHSAITTDDPAYFEHIPIEVHLQTEFIPLEIPFAMKARQLHTITVPEGTRAAWMVYEGAKDTGYDGLCYSIKNLRLWNDNGLYKPITESFIEENLFAYL